MRFFKGIAIALLCMAAQIAHAEVEVVNTDIVTTAKNKSFSNVYTFDVSSLSNLIGEDVYFSTSKYNISNFLVSLYSGTYSTGSTAIYSTDLSDFSVSGLVAGTYSLVVSGLSTGSQGGRYSLTASVAAVPEPETYALMGLGLLGLLAAKRRKLVATAA